MHKSDSKGDFLGYLIGFRQYVDNHAILKFLRPVYRSFGGVQAATCAKQLC